MDGVKITTDRTEMKFPLPHISAKIVAEAISDWETIRYMDAVPGTEYTEENAEGFLNFLKHTEASDSELELGIFLKGTNSFIGMCTLENIDQNRRSCELGYWLCSKYVGQGYMSECARALIQYAQNTLHMQSVNAFVITEHTKSIQLLERLGFIRKKLLEKDTENKGIFVDRYWYELLF